MTPPTPSLTIAALHSGYASGAFTPEDVIHTIYDRIDAYPDKAVWIHLIPRQQALDDAERLTSSLHASSSVSLTPLPPLYGIPFSVKDSIDVFPYPTTLACPTFAFVPDRTAPCVQRILDAGGIFIGKTNLDQFATGLSGHRSPYGTPRCVFDAEYISGGSSSGSAVSVGADLVSFTVATDTAGSTRVPAALNGVVGLKPTLGTISTVGLVPACKTADCITVISRTVADARVAQGVMTAYDEEDVYARQTLPAWPTLWPSGTRSIRFGIPPPDLLEVLSPEYARLFNTTISTLSSVLGLSPPRQFDYTPFSSANALLYGSSIVSQRLVAFDTYLQSHGYADLHPVVASIFQSSQGFDAVRAYKDIFDLQCLRRKTEIQFRDNIDVLIVPSTLCHFTVQEMDESPVERNKLLGSFTHFVNLLDLCAVQVPTGTWRNEEGREMPFGVTIIGQAGRDGEVLALGERVMEACRT
ncbi:putative glutamyl-tRNA amidotransferase subunit A [Coniochaeta sp. 2T2.1]|nr:putative glutamyl-tRNA amidotransferase subunit A [Coniochaeta sp. 2T2.1]